MATGLEKDDAFRLAVAVEAADEVVDEAADVAAALKVERATSEANER